MSDKLRVLVVGIGDMGGSHAKGYAQLDGYEIVGFVVAGNVERAEKFARELGLTIPIYTDYYTGMKEQEPDVITAGEL